MSSSVSPEDPLGGRIESAIVTIAPVLDMVLSVGERISRIAEPVDYEYYPVHDEDEDSPTS